MSIEDEKLISGKVLYLTYRPPQNKNLGIQHKQFYVN